MDLYKELKLAPVRSEPSVWISRVVIFEKLTPKPVLIRDIPLIRGVNIVWAEEPDDDDPSAEISGHSAGKTTFCRFLRYMLGEKTFGTKSKMESIRKALPSGYVAAEVHVGGKQWAVRRPIGTGRMSYIQENATIEELLEHPAGAVSQDDYPKRLGLESLLENLETATIVRTEEAIQWGHVLAWCSRDQEARFQSIHEWRSPRSQSESPGFQRPKEGPLFVMRAVLGLFLPDELKGEVQLAVLQRKQDRLEKQIEEKRREPEFWANRHDEDLRSRLAKILPNEASIETVPLHTDELFPDLSRLTERAVTKLESLLAAQTKQLAKLQEQIDNVGGQIREQESLLEQLDTLFDLENAASRELDQGLSARQQQRQQLKDHQHKECPFGGLPIRECHHVLERQTTLNITELQDARAMEQAEAKRAEEQKKLEAEISNLRSIIEGLEEQRAEFSSTRNELVKVNRHTEQELSALRSARRELETWIQRRDQGTDYPALNSLQMELEKTSGEIAQLEAMLTGLLRQHDENRELLASIFSTAVGAVLTSGTYDGNVSLDNREVSFRITHGTAMSGEAIETLSVLLFDITTHIYSSVSEGSVLPGFLLHDSPREADLGARIYRSFIRAVAGLQSHFASSDACPFQYVLTTTTPPPIELQGEDVVKLRLNAGKTSELLLRRNIAEPPQSEQSELF